MKKMLLLLVLCVTSSCSVILGSFISTVANQEYESDSIKVVFNSDGDFSFTQGSVVISYTLQHTSSNGVGTYKVGSQYAKVEINTADGELYIYETGVSKNAALNKVIIEYVLYKVDPPVEEEEDDLGDDE